MIVLVSFSLLENALFEKAAAQCGIADRIGYYDTHDDLLAKKPASGRIPMTNEFPRVVIKNIDSPTCIDELTALKSTENWKKIPVIGLGFLEKRSDVVAFYSAGGASCIRKPETYNKLLETTRAAMSYWLAMSTLPCDYLREA